jgi:tetraacyldisaccharide 4'-kinase
VPLSNFVQQAQDDPALRFTAVAGIAQPEVFFKQLRQRGIPLVATQSLPDHYDFDSWKREPYFRYVIFCTEKDAVKLWQVDADCWAVPLQVTVDSGLLTALDAALAPRLSLP